MTGIAKLFGRTRQDRELMPSVSHVRDAVYGGIDGAVTTFAIVAGVAGAGLSERVIVILGIANVLADGFSMAAGNYAGTKADSDDRARLRSRAVANIELRPEEALTRLSRAFEAKGFDGDLRAGAVAAIARNRAAWVDMILADDHGLGPSDPAPFHAAAVTLIAFLCAGFVPLIPFLIALERPFQTSAILTSVVFLAIGAAKSGWSLAPWWRSALETLLVGGSAAVIAYGVGTLFDV